MSVLHAQHLRLSLRKGRRERLLLEIDGLRLDAGQSLAVLRALGAPRGYGALASGWKWLCCWIWFWAMA
ncbi:MAG: hypothetical protein LUG19_09300 [Desulfovibrio sp.]|uniref:hypothetical protein n=1 Tax=Desulfovibrio sp. TaxID=885 RepID=UPI002586D356|nr:hypothetical protein [Desulfovibrio sp.]MCD7984432.1 hypothetical protein [Desulfovibrio sp.]